MSWRCIHLIDGTLVRDHIHVSPEPSRDARAYQMRAEESGPARYDALNVGTRRGTVRRRTSMRSRDTTGSLRVRDHVMGVAAVPRPPCGTDRHRPQRASTRRWAPRYNVVRG